MDINIYAIFKLNNILNISNKLIFKMTTKIICLSQDGRIYNISIDSSIKASSFDTSQLKNIKYKSGLGNLERECDYDYLDDKMITVYAWNNGRPGSENKHELPPPIDQNMYYGDVFALCHENENLTDLTIDEYKQFYEDAFGGFEDLADDEDDDENEEEEDDDGGDLKDFIVSDEENSDYHDSEEEDESEYDDLSDDKLLERYDVYKYYVDNMRKSGKSASLLIQNELKSYYNQLEKRKLVF